MSDKEVNDPLARVDEEIIAKMAKVIADTHAFPYIADGAAVIAKAIADNFVVFTKDGEPHFALVARDMLASDHVRYWGAARAHAFDMMDAIHKRLKERITKLPWNFNKDRAHQRSASAVAIQMELWQEKRKYELEHQGEGDNGGR